MDHALDRRTVEGTVTAERTAARIAGWGYLAIFVLALFANFFVLERLVEPDSASATVANIAGSEALFRGGLIAFLVIFVLDVVIAWAMYRVFLAVDPQRSLLAAWLRLGYTVFLGVGLVFWFRALDLVVSGNVPASAFDPAQRNAQVMQALDSFEATWLIGLAAFGLHLIVVGGLILRTAGVPRALGVVLVVAGLAYIADTVAHAALPDYQAVESLFLALVAIPSVVGELALGLWFLFRAGKRPIAARDPAPTGVPALGHATLR